jgi:tRNA(Arg) A34 adenosine deaminase TadA/CheY-like chemotaxis protein
MSAETKGHVIVVEPNDITRKLILGVVGKNGYTVYEARHGDEAVSHLARSKPDLVILDVEGDSVDSQGFITKIQKDHRKTPLIALTETADREAVQQRLNMPNLTFLDKPVNLQALLAAIESMLVAEAVSQASNARADTELETQRKILMRRAIDLSQQKMDENCGGPFGAVIARGSKIVGEGWNCVTSTNDPTAHAEMVAIRNASAALKSFKLDGCDIYTSCEPCPMCLAAIYWARIDKVFYGNMREDAERIGFDDALIYSEIALPENKRQLPFSRLLREEAVIVFDNWEKKRDRTKY